MCNVDTVDYFNNMKIYPRLQSILQKDYFRYFNYNAKKPCPFWNNTNDICQFKSCGVQACTPELDSLLHFRAWVDAPESINRAMNFNNIFRI